MALYTRSNAWNDGGTFANADLLWYARGVRKMQDRALADRASWWFFAAMHGSTFAAAFPGWGSLTPPPIVPTTPLPPQADRDDFWDQCQHQSWYFLPWHRGYLLALEAQIRADVVSLGGPPTWALPYWNYLGPGNAFRLPPAFASQQLPDGSPNPLFVTHRYGPRGDGNVFIPSPPVSQASMSNDLFTGTNVNTPPPGFGGPDTGFAHGGGDSGNLEGNPHNLVHVFVGGQVPSGEPWGLMSDPDIAALDPIFYLHHANIDRLWAAWNANPANVNPSHPNWLAGPAAIGDRPFMMPMPANASWTFTPQEVSRLDLLNYSYDDVTPPAAPGPILLERLARLGGQEHVPTLESGGTMISGENVELVGANEGTLQVRGAGARTTVRLEPVARRKITESLESVGEGAAVAPDRVFLNLENVRGVRDAHVLSAYINVPENESPESHPELLAGSVGLFGVRRATLEDGSHGGAGLNFVLEITDIVDRLHLSAALDAESVDVRIVPFQEIPEQAQITVGRVSIYRQGR